MRTQKKINRILDVYSIDIKENHSESLMFNNRRGLIQYIASGFKISIKCNIYTRTGLLEHPVKINSIIFHY